MNGYVISFTPNYCPWCGNPIALNPANAMEFEDGVEMVCLTCETSYVYSPNPLRGRCEA